MSYQHPQPRPVELPTLGAHTARLIQIVDLGTQVKKGRNGSEYHANEICFGFELDELMNNGRRWLIRKRLKWSWDSNSELRRWLEGWNNGPFHDDYTPRMSQYFHQLATVNVAYFDINGVSKPTISDVYPANEGAMMSPTRNTTVLLSLHTEQYNHDEFLKLDPYWKKVIARSPQHQKAQHDYYSRLKAQQNAGR